MATITPRGKFQWQAKIRRKGFPEVSKTCDTKVEAEAWARSIESKMDKGSFVDRSPWENLTLGEILERYRKEITPAKKGAEQEESKLTVISKSKLAKMSLGNIEPGDIVDYRNERLKKVAAATIIKELNLISNAYVIAASEWRMRGLRNPVTGVRRPKPPRGRTRRLASETEMDGLIAATDSVILKAIIPFAVETAMRRGEMTSLTWADVDLERQTAFLEDTKNDESRTVPLSLKAVALLREIQGGKGEKVFKAEPSSVTQAFGRAVKRARKTYELECEKTNVVPDEKLYRNLLLHDMRHEATSRLFEKGFDLMETASVTGHKDLRMLKRYTHLNAETLAKKLG